MGECQKAQVGKLLLGGTDSDIMDQMPPLVQDIMEDTYIHILQVMYKIRRDQFRFLKKSFMHFSRAAGIVMPGDIGAFVCIDDFILHLLLYRSKREYS